MPLYTAMFWAEPTQAGSLCCAQSEAHDMLYQIWPVLSGQQLQSHMRKVAVP